MNRTISPLLVGLLVLVFGCPGAWAQATAQISGAAADQSGAALPGVEITMTQTATGIVILRVLSGDYFSVTTTQDRALNGMINQRVNLLQAGPYGNKTAHNYLKAAAFAMPALGTLGNLGQAGIAGPKTWQFDVALTRGFQIRESKKVEFRVEAFNLTNSVRLNDPVNNFNAGNFGQITSAQDPRIMQFALKYAF